MEEESFADVLRRQHALFPAALVDGEGWERLVERGGELPASAVTYFYPEFRLDDPAPAVDFFLAMGPESPEARYFIRQGEHAAPGSPAAGFAWYLAEIGRADSALVRWSNAAWVGYDLIGAPRQPSAAPGFYIRVRPTPEGGSGEAAAAPGRGSEGGSGEAADAPLGAPDGGSGEAAGDRQRASEGGSGEAAAAPGRGSEGGSGEAAGAPPGASEGGSGEAAEDPQRTARGETAATLARIVGWPPDAEEQRAVERAFDALPPGARVTWAGAMPGRRRSIRLVTAGIAQAPEFLERLGWPGRMPTVLRALAAMEGFFSRTSLVSFNVSADGPLPNLGLELHGGEARHWLKTGVQECRPLLDRLADHGWCLPAKRDALMGWLGRERFFTESGASLVWKGLNHVKVTIRGDAIGAKAYVGMAIAPIEPVDGEREESGSEERG